MTLSEEQHAVSNRRAAGARAGGQGASFCCRTTARSRDRSTASSRSACSSMSASAITAPSSRRAAACSLTDGVDGAALHRPHRRPGRHQRLDPALHLPRRLYSGHLGGHPARSRRRGSDITDMEILRLHYAKTLRRWRERFLAHREEVAALYDERFCRIWEFYLAASEVAFRDRADDELPAPAHQEPDRRAADAQLHVRERGGVARQRTAMRRCR